MVIAAAAIAVAVPASVLAIRTVLPHQQPEPIAAAVADFATLRMTVEDPPRTAAPDLSDTRFALYHMGAGTLAGLEVDGFLYKDANGHRVLIYRSTEPFPVASGAHMTPAGDWRAEVAGVQLLCTQQPHAMLALATDPSALEEVAAVLGIDG